MDAGERRPVLPRIGCLAPLLALTGAALLAGCGGGESGEDKGQTVRFQKPTDRGPDSFVKGADVRAPSGSRWARAPSAAPAPTSSATASS